MGKCWAYNWSIVFTYCQYNWGKESMRPCLLLDVCPNHPACWCEDTSPTHSSECLPKHGTYITVGALSVERLVMLFIDTGIHHSAWGKFFSNCTLSSEHVISQSKVCKNFIACISLGRVFIIHFWILILQSKLHALSTAPSPHLNPSPIPPPDSPFLVCPCCRLALPTTFQSPSFYSFPLIPNPTWPSLVLDQNHCGWPDAQGPSSPFLFPHLACN